MGLMGPIGPISPRCEEKLCLVALRCQWPVKFSIENTENPIKLEAAVAAGLRPAYGVFPVYQTASFARHVWIDRSGRFEVRQQPLRRLVRDGRWMERIRVA